MTAHRDPSLDALLELDGQVLVVDPEGGHWVKFVVREVPVSLQKPHGLTIRSRYTGLRASGWSGSTMRIAPAAVTATSPTIIATGFGP